MADIKKLEKELWEAADNLRANSKLTSQQYCMPVLGLIFLRYAWGRFKSADAQIKESRTHTVGRQVPIEVADYTKRGVMFLPEEARYDYLLSLPESEANIGRRVNDAMTALERQNPQLIGVLPQILVTICCVRHYASSTTPPSTRMAMISSVVSTNTSWVSSPPRLQATTACSLLRSPWSA